MKNLIAFFEIPAADFRRAVEFYETVLNVDLDVVECGDEKMAFFTEQGEVVGAISYAADFHPSASGTLIHFYCEDLETALQKVIEKGGSIIIPITKIEAEGKGHFAVFADSEGNHVGLYKGV